MDASLTSQLQASSLASSCQLAPKLSLGFWGSYILGRVGLLKANIYRAQPLAGHVTFPTRYLSVISHVLSLGLYHWGSRCRTQGLIGRWRNFL